MHTFSAFYNLYCCIVIFIEHHACLTSCDKIYKVNAYYEVSIYTVQIACLVGRANAIYTNSTHQRVIGTVNTEKRPLLNISFSGVDVRRVLFYAIDPSSNPPFAKLFFLPFQISYRIGKAFIFNKNEGNNQNKVSGKG